MFVFPEWLELFANQKCSRLGPASTPASSPHHVGVGCTHLRAVSWQHHHRRLGLGEDLAESVALLQWQNFFEEAVSSDHQPQVSGPGNIQDHRAPSIPRPRGLGGQTGFGGAPTRNIHHPGLTAKSSRSRDRWSLVVLGISLAHEVGLPALVAFPRHIATVLGAVCYRWPRTPRRKRWEGARYPCGAFRSQY